jgi:hypothetical protein
MALDIHAVPHAYGCGFLPTRSKDTSWVSYQTPDDLYDCEDF